MTIEERLEKLELELAAAKRLTRRLMAVAGVVLGMFVLFMSVRVITGVAYGQAEEKVIRANKFIVEDAQGRTRVALTVSKGVPCLAIYDEKEKPCIGLALAGDGPCLTLYDDKGKGRIVLALIKDGPGLTLHDEKGAARIILALVKDVPCITLWNEKGNLLWQAP